MKCFCFCFPAYEMFLFLILWNVYVSHPVKCFCFSSSAYEIFLLNLSACEMFLFLFLSLWNISVSFSQSTKCFCFCFSAYEMFLFLFLSLWNVSVSVSRRSKIFLLLSHFHPILSVDPLSVKACWVFGPVPILIQHARKFGAHVTPQTSELQMRGISKASRATIVCTRAYGKPGKMNEMNGGLGHDSAL